MERPFNIGSSILRVLIIVVFVRSAYSRIQKSFSGSLPLYGLKSCPGEDGAKTGRLGMFQLPGNSREIEAPCLPDHGLGSRSVWREKREGREGLSSIRSVGDRKEDNLAEVRGQALLGEDDFVDKLVDHLKAQAYPRDPEKPAVFYETPT